MGEDNEKLLGQIRNPQEIQGDGSAAFPAVVIVHTPFRGRSFWVI
ncbi:MAG TPA: hypothetical protein PKV48_06645 [Thermodesulfobacteriota bacterium]|nr:hypothetical protein [Thermodesulfobacteriota bacterium]